MDNGNENRRHFLVAKQGRDVIVREVPQGSCAYTLTREQAWDRAQHLREYGNDKKRIRPGRLIVVGLDNMSTETEWPEEKVTEVLDNEDESVHNEPMTNSNLERVVNHLRKLNLEGKLNTFTHSLLDQYERRGTLSDKQIACVVRTLDETPAQAMPKPDLEVPAGRYAVTDNEGTLRFFKLDRPTEGRWAGYTFLKMQASDETYPVRDRAKRDRILAKIAQDPQQAMLTYGKELGHCGHCGRTLTDETSRNAGIGPVCAGRMGW